MKDLRFYGISGATTVDITFRTDMIGTTDENFNITQIQVGEQFDVNDKSDEDHINLFNDFKELPNNLTTFKNFAAAKGLSLSIADSTGDNLVILRQEESVSESY